MVVLDASTAILLAKIELLDQFAQHAGQGLIMPHEALLECRGRQTLDALLINRAIEERRILIKKVERRIAATLSRDYALGAGEAAAIALAGQGKGHLVATDDKRAINACKVLRMPFTTAVSILVWMKDQSLLDGSEANRKLDILAHHGRYKKEILDAARRDLGD